ncbi:MAG: hypothetical protein ABIH71_00265 [Candidatus Omnitrophota bacterium]|nr:hypothetical protein [Candidatus Omnitrophota bacterium]
MEEFIKNKEKLINEQINATIDIKDEFGIEKAIGYLVGEKFYSLIKEFQYLQKNHKDKTETINDFRLLVLEGSKRIMEIFAEDEINNYFKLNPRFGSLGHVVTEDEHKLFVEKGAVEHTIDTEIEDTLIMGEMKKYLKISL